MEISMKTYILTIEYNEDTEEIEYMSEEIVNDEESTFFVGEIDLADIFDKESLKLIAESYIIGES